MRCPNCGIENSSRFCPNCGTRMPADIPAAPAAPSGPAQGFTAPVLIPDDYDGEDKTMAMPVPPADIRANTPDFDFDDDEELEITVSNERESVEDTSKLLLAAAARKAAKESGSAPVPASAPSPSPAPAPSPSQGFTAPQGYAPSSGYVPGASAPSGPYSASGAYSAPGVSPAQGAYSAPGVSPAHGAYYASGTPSQGAYAAPGAYGAPVNPAAPGAYPTPGYTPAGTGKAGSGIKNKKIIIGVAVAVVAIIAVFAIVKAVSSATKLSKEAKMCYEAVAANVVEYGSLNGYSAELRETDFEDSVVYEILIDGAETHVFFSPDNMGQEGSMLATYDMKKKTDNTAKAYNTLCVSMIKARKPDYSFAQATSAWSDILNQAGYNNFKATLQIGPYQADFKMEDYAVTFTI